MAHNFLGAEERRRISMALSMRDETAARLAQLRHELLAIFRSTFRKPPRRKSAASLEASAISREKPYVRYER